MKFCKNLQRVVDISDPAWAPYWLNYKFLKKLIKDLSTTPEVFTIGRARLGSSASIESTVDSSSPTKGQQRGDITAEKSSIQVQNLRLPWKGGCKGSTTTVLAKTAQHQKEPPTAPIGKSPGEVAFFKILHAELRKAEFFFDRTSAEFRIREERVRKGMDIFVEQNVVMKQEKWRAMAKAIYQLYKDLLLLETFAIMTFVGFSKILKKHDKITGHQTRNAFMENIVNKANFTTYPELMELIGQCEGLHARISEILERDGKTALSEDERLFISMIHRLNEQVLESDKDDTDEGQTTTKLTSRSQPPSGSLREKLLAECAEEERNPKKRQSESDSMESSKPKSSMTVAVKRARVE